MEVHFHERLIGRHDDSLRSRRKMHADRGMDVAACCSRHAVACRYCRLRPVLALVGGIGVGLARGSASATDFLLGARYTLMGGAIVAAGPLGVWLVRRRRVWLVAFLGLIVLTGIVALKYFVDSLDAPSEEEIFGTIL